MKECIRKADNLKSYYLEFVGDNCGIQDANIFFRKLSDMLHTPIPVHTKYTKSSLVNLIVEYNEQKVAVKYNSYIIFNIFDKSLINVTKDSFESDYQIK